MNYVLAYGLLGFQFLSVLGAIALMIMCIWTLIWR